MIKPGEIDLLKLADMVTDTKVLISKEDMEAIAELIRKQRTQRGR